MVAFGMGVTWLGYSICLYGYCLTRQYQVGFLQLVQPSDPGLSWPPPLTADQASAQQAQPTVAKQYLAPLVQLVSLVGAAVSTLGSLVGGAAGAAGQAAGALGGAVSSGTAGALGGLGQAAAGAGQAITGTGGGPAKGVGTVPKQPTVSTPPGWTVTTPTAPPASGGWTVTNHGNQGL